MARHRSRHAGGIPPVLFRLIQAAKRAGNDAEGRDMQEIARYIADELAIEAGLPVAQK